jgi:hypothetical protein
MVVELRRSSKLWHCRQNVGQLGVEGVIREKRSPEDGEIMLVPKRKITLKLNYVHCTFPQSQFYFK